MRSKDRVTVAWVDPGQVDAMFAVSMLGLYAARGSRIASVIRVGGGLLSRQRNEVVQAFLNSNESDWMFFIDSDETITPESFDKLINAAHATDRPVVAGLYFGAWENGGLYPDAVPMIMLRNETGRYTPVEDIPADDIIPIDAAGTGALLIHRSVLEAIRDASNSGPMAEHEQGLWCWFRDMAVGGSWFGEDIFFCARVRDLGFPIVAATGARLSHHKSFWVTDAHYLKGATDGRH